MSFGGRQLGQAGGLQSGEEESGRFGRCINKDTCQIRVRYMNKVMNARVEPGIYAFGGGCEYEL